LEPLYDAARTFFKESLFASFTPSLLPKPLRDPEGAKIQMEGCITMGLGYALTEEVHFKGGRVLDTNYDTYEIPRFSWVPKIETVLIENNETAPQGGGEPAIVLMGALIANAIHDATGARLFQLPMTPDRVKTTLQKV
jgi:CO/xanthine dehydrogenase Mo-binding subunit